MAAGEVGVSYTASLSATGGPTPYTWSLDSGTIPGGLTLGTDGGVSGVPTAPGTFSFTVKASDATNQYTTQGATIKIAPHLTAALIPACAQACYVEQGCVNVCGNFGSQAGGVGPFTYQGSGNIPGGMKLSALSLAGSFPQLAQFWQFNVTITDALGATASVTPTFYVFRHITITKTAWVCGGGRNSPTCQLSIPYVGGTPGGKPTMKVVGVTGYAGRGGATIGTFLVTGSCAPQSTTKPPPWMTWSASGGTLTFTMPRIPSPYCSYFGRVTIELVDQSPCGSPTYCTSNTAVIDINV